MPDRPTPTSSPPLASREAEAILQQGLRLIRERSDAVLNAVDDGIYVLDHRGHTIFANEAAVRMLGYTLREMLGQPQHGLIHYARADGSGYPVEECPIYHSVHDGIYERVGGDVFWRKDGRPLRVDYTCVPIKQGRELQGAVVTFRDASDQHLAREQALQLASDRRVIADRDRALAEAADSREVLEQAFEHAPVSITLTRGAEHRIAFANAMARALAGDRVIVGSTMAEAFPSLAGQRSMALRDRVLETGEPQEVRGMTVRWDRDGRGDMREARFDSRYLPVRDAGGRVVGVLTWSSPSTESSG